jgi:hypothetical protein
MALPAAALMLLAGYVALIARNEDVTESWLLLNGAVASPPVATKGAMSQLHLLPLPPEYRSQQSAAAWGCVSPSAIPILASGERTLERAA